MAGLRASNVAFLGRVGMTAPAYDADAQTIITAVENADGQTLETVVRNAIDAFVVGCKAAGIYTALASGVFRFLSGPRTLAGIAKAGVGPDPTIVGFVSGDYNRARLKGITGSGKYLNANLNNQDLPQNDAHLSTWIQQRVDDNAIIGAQVGSDFNNRIANNFRLRGGNINISGFPANGFTGVSRESSTTLRARGNAITSTTEFSSLAPLSGSIFVFSQSSVVQTTSGNGLSWYSAGLNLGATGLSLLDAQLATYMAAIEGI